MSNTKHNEGEDIDVKQIIQRLNVTSGKALVTTLLAAVFGAILYMLLKVISWPYVMAGLFKLGLLPFLAVIPAVGAIRGPIAGFLTGYLGEVLHGFIFYGFIIHGTLDAAAYGILGLIVGILTYEFESNRSLVKLSFLSIFGAIMTILLVSVIALFIGLVSTEAFLAFVFLPLLTMGIPSVALLTPIYTRGWHAIALNLVPRVVKGPS